MNHYQPHPFTSHILAWYKSHARTLPWRETVDPYRIWLSEIILQQTRVAQGLPYYRSFVDAFPSLPQLAAASEQEVLRLWQGLGYYSRARNLLACARQVMQAYGGRFPASFSELKKLKGVGPYTAAAIASFAFGEPVPVVDGNVFRLLSRYLGIDLPVNSSRAYAVFFEASEKLLFRDDPAAYNQAVMEFGSQVCLPKNPPCNICVLKESCHAFATGQQARLPVKKKAKPPRHRYFNYLILHQDDRILMRKREADDIWKGLFEFYLIETEDSQAGEEILNYLPSKMREQVSEVDKNPFVTRHVLSHQRIFASFTQVELQKEADLSKPDNPFNLTPYSREEVEHLPKPVLINNYLKLRKI